MLNAIVLSSIYISLRLGTGFSGGFLTANLAPVMALGYCSPLLMSRKFRWLPLVLLAVTDLLLSLRVGWSLQERALVYVMTALAIVWGEKCLATMKSSAWLVLGNVLCLSILFYTVTNLLCFASGMYVFSWGGLAQCMWRGIPGYPPTWSFFTNTFLGDQIFALVSIMVYNASPAHSSVKGLSWVSES